MVYHTSTPTLCGSSDLWPSSKFEELISVEPYHTPEIPTGAYVGWHIFSSFAKFSLNYQVLFQSVLPFLSKSVGCRAPHMTYILPLPMAATRVLSLQGSFLWLRICSHCSKIKQCWVASPNCDDSLSYSATGTLLMGHWSNAFTYRFVNGWLLRTVGICGLRKQN